MNRVVILGRSISASLTAAYLKRSQPDLDITMIGPPVEKRPVVGESLIEFSTHMLHKLGLGRHLEEDQFHKYGLTFYFKESIEDTSCRRYAVHEGPACPPMPSNQLNRATVQARLDRLVDELGIERHDGKATTVETLGPNQHQVQVELRDGAVARLDCDWVIDATGRRRLLARQHKLHRDAEHQRSSFWFRLENFDRDFLDRLEAVKEPQEQFDSYFCTHHFMGHGNWIWCIPCKRPEPGYLMSVGITWRPDLYEGVEVKDMDSFLRQVEREHPVVAELVRSGQVVDTNLYRNYMYETSKLYSSDGWFIVGDAGNAVDPLYSTGLSMASVQVEQVEAMIRRGREGRLTPDYVQALEGCYTSVFRTFQDGITHQYPTMHDPYAGHWYVHLLTISYFFFVLPSWLAGYHCDPVGARFMSKILELAHDDFQSLLSLLWPGSARLGRLPAEAIRNHYDETVNWDLWGPDPQGVSEHVAHMLEMYAAFRMELLRNAGWTRWPHHVSIAAADRMRARMIRTLFGGKSLADSKAIARFVDAPALEPPAAHTAR